MNIKISFIVVCRCCFYYVDFLIVYGVYVYVVGVVS